MDGSVTLIPAKYYDWLSQSFSKLLSKVALLGKSFTQPAAIDWRVEKEMTVSFWEHHVC